MPCTRTPADDDPYPHRPGSAGLNEEQAALLAHAALFDHLAPVGGARVLVHDAADPTGFHAVQLAKAAGAWTVAAAVRGDFEAAAARRAGADLVIDAVSEDPVGVLRRPTGHERPIQRIVHGRFGREPGIDLAVLAAGGIIAGLGLSSARRCDAWWQDFLAGGITLKLMAYATLPETALDRARTDVRCLQAAGLWRDAPPQR